VTAYDFHLSRQALLHPSGAALGILWHETPKSGRCPFALRYRLTDAGMEIDATNEDPLVADLSPFRHHIRDTFRSGQ
jgi:hypothetical protein